jgi:tetratricopeptide (TPR) repeat protein
MSDDADEPADRDRARDGEGTRDGRRRTDPDGDHEFSSGQGFGDPYEGFDLDPPELNVDPGQIDPVDSRVVADTLDDAQVGAEQVDAEELLEVGLSYIRINRYEQAADAFERVARFTDDERLEQEAWVNKGVVHAELEEYDQAEGSYREALRIDDENDHAASARTNLAYALHESGRTEQALEHAERAVELDPRFPQAWYNRGFFLLERGLAEDAVDAFDNALRLGFRNAEVLDEKARALEELGEYDEAEEVAEEAEQLRERAEQELVEDHGGGGPGAGAGGAPPTDPSGPPTDEPRDRHRE